MLYKSKSNDNPVFYVCYAYARICSILSKRLFKVIFAMLGKLLALTLLEKKIAIKNDDFDAAKLTKNQTSDDCLFFLPLVPFFLQYNAIVI